MRARWLKPEFFTDKKVAEFGPITALVYQALWCMADDGGTAPCDPDTIKAQMFYRWSAVGVPEISEALRHLSAVGRIVRYTVGDDTYCMIASWAKHQQVHKPSKFRHPPLSHGVAMEVPEQCGTGEAPLPASPPPRHLDSQTPRHLLPPGGGAENGRTPAIRLLSPGVSEVVEHYRRVHPRRRPSETELRLVGKQLKTYTVAELIEAIDGNASDPWAMETKNQGLAYVLRNNSTIDKYRALAEQRREPLVDANGLPTERAQRILAGKA